MRENMMPSSLRSGPLLEPQQQEPQQHQLRQQQAQQQEQQRISRVGEQPLSLKRFSSYRPQLQHDEQGRHTHKSGPGATPARSLLPISNPSEGILSNASRRAGGPAATLRRSATDLPVSMLHASEAAQIYATPVSTLGAFNSLATLASPQVFPTKTGVPSHVGSTATLASSHVTAATTAAATLTGNLMTSTPHVATSSTSASCGDMQSSRNTNALVAKNVYPGWAADSDSHSVTVSGRLSRRGYTSKQQEYQPQQQLQKKSQQRTWAGLCTVGGDVGPGVQSKGLWCESGQEGTFHSKKEFTGDSVEFLSTSYQYPYENQEVTVGDLGEDCETFRAAKLKDGLFVGDDLAAANADFLIVNKVTHIINCNGLQTPDFFADTDMKITYLTFSWPERGANILDHGDMAINQIYKFIENSAAQGESCLVHSQKGQSRACVTLVAYLMIKYSWSLTKTKEFISRRHQELKIAPEYESQLQQFEQRLLHEKGVTLSKEWACLPPAMNKKNHAEEEASDEYLITNTFLNSLTSTFPTANSVFFGCLKPAGASKSQNACWPVVVPEKSRGRKLRWFGEETMTLPQIKGTTSEKLSASNSGASKGRRSILKDHKPWTSSCDTAPGALEELTEKSERQLAKDAKGTRTAEDNRAGVPTATSQKLKPNNAFTGLSMRADSKAHLQQPQQLPLAPQQQQSTTSSQQSQRYISAPPAQHMPPTQPSSFGQLHLQQLQNPQQLQQSHLLQQQQQAHQQQLQRQQQVQQQQQMQRQQLQRQTQVQQQHHGQQRQTFQPDGFMEERAGAALGKEKQQRLPLLQEAQQPQNQHQQQSNNHPNLSPPALSLQSQHKPTQHQQQFQQQQQHLEQQQPLHRNSIQEAGDGDRLQQGQACTVTQQQHPHSEKKSQQNYIGNSECAAKEDTSVPPDNKRADAGGADDPVGPGKHKLSEEALRAQSKRQTNTQKQNKYTRSNSRQRDTRRRRFLERMLCLL